MISAPAYPYAGPDRRARYLRDLVPVRLGNLASTLARISTCARSAGGHVTVQDGLGEAAHFIEWTGPEVDPAIQPDLVSIQVELAQWRLRWPDVPVGATSEELAQRAREMSEQVLRWSGLLSE